MASELPGYRLSKFQPLMPRWVEQEMLATFLLDIEGAWRWLSGGGALARVPLQPGVVEPAPVAPAPIAPHPWRAPAEPARTTPPELPEGVTWIASLEALGEAAILWRGAEAIGFDVETTIGSQALCLIQVATQDHTWLIDPFAISDLEPLAEVLAAIRPTKVIHNATFERTVMAKHGIDIRGVFDTLAESRRRKPKADGGHSLRKVCERELGLEIDKTEQTSDWSRRPLTASQLRYAALDAQVLMSLWALWDPRLGGSLFGPGAG